MVYEDLRGLIQKYSLMFVDVFIGILNHWTLLVEFPDIENLDSHQKVPLTAYGRPGTWSVFASLLG